jgi:hypothetical protein
LKESFNASEVLQDEFVPGIELDARLAVDTFRAQLCTELALWFRSITPRLSRATDFTLVGTISY